MSDIGKAYVQIVPSAKGLKDSISKELDGEATSAGSKAGIGIASAMKKALVAAGIGKAIISTIQEGGKLEQSLGGVETLFKDNANKVKKHAIEAYRTTGISANSYMENVTGFSASLLQSLGGDTAKAAEVANMAMIDMADNSNKMGTSMEAIQNAYQGFAKQNYTMLDNLKLGYGGTKSEMQRLLADAQKLTGVKYDINNLSDVYSAIHAIQGKLDITGTTAKEASTTIAGSFNAMKSSFSNVLGALATGFGLDEALNGLAQTVSTFLFGNLIPMIGRILIALPGALYTFLTAVIPQFIQMGSELVNGIISGFDFGMVGFQANFSEMLNMFTSIYLPEFLNKGVQLITELANGLLQAMPTVITGIGEILNSLLIAIYDIVPQILESGYELVKNLAVGIFNNLPAVSESINKVLSKLLTTVVEHGPKVARKGFELLGKMAMGIWNNLPQIISTITNVLISLMQTIGSHLPQILQKGVELLGEFALGIVSAIPTVVAKIPELISALLSSFGSFISSFVDMGGQLLMGLARGIAGAVGNVISSAIDACKGIVSRVKSFFGIHSPSRLFAEMGMYLDYGLAEGIADNTKPISKAMDKVSDLTSKSLTSQLAYDISTNKPSMNFKNIENNLETKSLVGNSDKKPVILNFKIGKQGFKALVDDITELQNKEVELQLAYI